MYDGHVYIGSETQESIWFGNSNRRNYYDCLGHVPIISYVVNGGEKITPKTSPHF